MDDFGGRLAFKVEWENPGGVWSPELAATWCRLEVWIDELCLTQVEEIANASTRRSIYVPLYPLAEWAAYNWWFLQAHSRPAAAPTQRWTYDVLTRQHKSNYGWLRHHNVRSAGDGYPWPDLTIVPEGEYTRIAWSASPRPNARGGLRYLGSGEALIPSLEVGRSLAGLIATAITRLDESGVIKSHLHEEWAAQTQLESDEQDFCVAAARLGLDAFDMDDGAVQSLESVGDALSGELLTDFLDAVPVDQLTSTLEWVTGSLSEIETLTSGPGAGDVSALREVLRAAARTAEARNPWDVGYAEARAVREALSLNVVDYLDIEAYVATEIRPHATHYLDGVGDSKGAPRILLAREGPKENKRFAAARGLWHVLAEDPETPFLLTHARAYRQKIERAFAAELLAPAAGISQLLGEGTPADTDALDAIAKQYRVRSRLVDYQIVNNGLT